MKIASKFVKTNIWLIILDINELSCLLNLSFLNLISQRVQSKASAWEANIESCDFILKKSVQSRILIFHYCYWLFIFFNLTDFFFLKKEMEKLLN